MKLEHQNAGTCCDSRADVALVRRRDRDVVEVLRSRRARRAFAKLRPPARRARRMRSYGFPRRPVSFTVAAMDKRTTAAAVVAELRDGMTLGIGGWGSRRKPMALVREILRSPVKDLTVVSYGGPDVGLLCAAGKVAQAGLRLRLARLDSARAAFPRRAPGGHVRGGGVGRGHVAVGPLRRRAAPAVPADARRARLRRDDDQPAAAHGAIAVRRRRGARRRSRPPPRRRDRPHESRRRARQRPVPRPRPVLRRPLLHGREAPLPVVRAARRDARLREVRLGAHAEDQPHDGGRRRRDADGRALHRMPAGLRSRRGVPEGVRRDGEEPRSVGRVPQALPRRRRRGGSTRRPCARGAHKQ